MTVMLADFEEIVDVLIHSSIQFQPWVQLCQLCMNHHEILRFEALKHIIVFLRIVFE